MILLCVALIFSLLSPEVEGAAVRGKGRKRGGKVGGYKRNGRRQAGRKIPIRKRKGRWSDTDVATDDSAGNEADVAAAEPATKDAGAIGAAGALGDLTGICEILMFDKGEGGYSLKFIKNC